jgi:hypothetical protein
MSEGDRRQNLPSTQRAPIDIRALAARLNLPATTNNVEAHSWERLRLGQLTQITTTRPSVMVVELVKRHQRMWAERGRPQRAALGFDEYVDHQKMARRFKPADDPLDQPSFSADLKGYLAYLRTGFPYDELGRYIDAAGTPPASIEEERDRRFHTLAVGGSRSGKTELVKLLVHHYVRHPELGGVLVVDPHADMARQIARWKEFAGKGAERLVFLDAGTGVEHGAGVPALNPLVIGDDATPDEVAIRAGQLAGALVYFGGGNEGLTDQMERLAAYCLQVLLEMKRSTLADLVDGLRVRQRGEKGAPQQAEAEFVRRGKAHPNKYIREFFQYDWDGESYRSSRDALRRRLQTHFRLPTFERIMTAPDPLDLEALLNAGKVVVLNCQYGDEAGLAVGRFVVAQVSAMGHRRLANARADAPPVHVFVDEASMLMTPPFVKILEQFAKRNIWMTISQHGAGEGGERDFIKRVRRSTGLKFLGRGDVKEIMSNVDVPRESIPDLEQGDFITVKKGFERAPMLLRTWRPSPVADDRNAMSEAEWSAMLKDQFARYYRQPPKALPAPAAAGASMAKNDWQEW